ncbi:MAG: hypothetical protein EXR47_08455 [Dehalococcoidia bacterium]|nr:hypothetical protein [Dehalococcoidia bacterium]
MMRKNPLKAKLRNGEAIVGLFINLPSPALVEMTGLMGYDYVIIDGEHGIADLESCEHMVRAAEAVGITPLVRIAENDPQNILRYLDAGAMGVQIPMVNSKADAEAVVRSVFYPPKGRRGLAGVRASRYGIGMSMPQYVGMANEELLAIVQIETTQAVANAKEICAVDGVDIIFIGPSDLSSSMGLAGQPTHPDVLRSIEAVGKVAQAAGKAAGTIARDAEAYEHWRAAGFQYLATGVTNLVQSAGVSLLASVHEREARISSRSAGVRRS